MESNPLGSPVESKPIAGSVLIVDDNPLVLESVSMLIDTMGYSTITAADGQDAVDMFAEQSEKISLVIMDVEMPRLGGIDAAQRIRALKPSAKLVLYSGFTRQDVWRAKPNAFLHKPFMHFELREVICNLLNEDGAYGQGDEATT